MATNNNKNSTVKYTATHEGRTRTRNSSKHVFAWASWCLRDDMGWGWVAGFHATRAAAQKSADEMLRDGETVAVTEARPVAS